MKILASAGKYKKNRFVENKEQKKRSVLTGQASLSQKDICIKTKAEILNSFNQVSSSQNGADTCELDSASLFNDFKGEKEKLRFIVSAGDDNLLVQLKNEGEHLGKVVRDLNIVNGFSVEMESNTAAGWLSPYIASGKNVTVMKDKLFPVNWNPSSPPNLLRANQYDTTMKTVGMDYVWARGFTGKGITIAFVDSGVYPHEDFKGRIIGWKDMDDPSKIAPHDERGHGTHVAGLMVGDGKMSWGQMKGAAPGASLVAVKIKSEFTSEEDEMIAVSEAIAGLQWILDNKHKYNIKVVNLSLGVTPTTGWKKDLWAQAVEKVVAAGIVVVTVAGNENDPLFCRCITTPGIAPSAVTVGAIDDQNTINPNDDSIYYRSSRGPTIDGLTKPEMVAPGVNVLSTLAPGSSFAENNPKAKYYVVSTGTSQAAPIVSGLVAVLLEANPHLKPADIKEILVESSRWLEDVDPNAQGAGVIFGPAALELALKKKQSSAA